MVHELKRLGTKGFEELVQALAAAIAGFDAKIYGAGRDNQRELTVEPGSFVWGDLQNKGCTVGQAKFKSQDGAERDIPWVKRNLREELEGFRAKREQGERIPETWLFFTNVILTPVKGGGRDQAEEVAEAYRDVVPNIHIFGCDDIRAMLDAHPEVARRYSSFLLPGDVLGEVYGFYQRHCHVNFETFVEYTNQRFREDHHVNALTGECDLRKVYTDLDAASGGERHPVAASLLSLGDRLHRGNGDRDGGNLLLLGQAGQGKTTLCQYLCQIYRASLLSTFRPRVRESEEYRTRLPGASWPGCARFPVFIRLKKYREWMGKQDAHESRSVLRYLHALIDGQTGRRLDIRELYELLQCQSWLFCFDGLDEVADQRGEVLRELNTFLTHDLKENDCDCLVVCTSRPQGYHGELEALGFQTLTLEPMSPDLCRGYLDRLLEVLEQDPVKRQGCRQRLETALNQPLSAKLMETPLYTALMTQLVQAGRTPPAQRFALFREFCAFSIQREEKKGGFPLTDGGTAWVWRFHAELAFTLHSRPGGEQGAELPEEDCRALLARYGDTDKLYPAVTERLPFVEQVADSGNRPCVCFPLQSIQEFFTALWLVTIRDEDALSLALEALSLNAYWQNVLLFAAGYFAEQPGRRVRRHELLRLCRRNDGLEYDCPDPTACTIALPGARLALALLCDDMLPGEMVPAFLEQAARLLGWKSNDSDAQPDFLRLPPALRERFLQEYAIPHVRERRDAGDAGFLFVWQMANQGSMAAVDCLEDVAEDLTPPSYSRTELLLIAGYRGVWQKMFMRLFRWVTQLYYLEVSRERLTGFWGHFAAYERRTNQRNLPLKARRLAVYRLIQGRTSNGAGWVKDPLVQRLWQERGFKGLLFFPEHIGPNLKYRPLFTDSEPKIAAYADAFDKYRLPELAALARFQDRPGEQTLTALLNAMGELPPPMLNAFCDFLQNGNWLMAEIARRVAAGEAPAVLAEDYANRGFDDLKERDGLLYEVWKTDDPGAVLWQGLWREIAIVRSVGNWDVKTYLEGISSAEGLEAFLSLFDLRAFPDEDTARLAVQRFPEITRYCHRRSFAQMVFSRTDVRWLLRCGAQYPDVIPTTLGYTGHISAKAEKVARLVEWGEYEAFALAPAFYKSDEDGEEPDFPPAFAQTHLPDVRATGNPCALLGCILTLLTGPLPEELHEAVTGDLNALLPQALPLLSDTRIRDQLHPDGLLLIYKLVQGREDLQEPERSRLLRRYPTGILHSLRSAPVDRNRLEKQTRRDRTRTWALLTGESQSSKP